jgi:hypothetical protein
MHVNELDFDIDYNKLFTTFLDLGLDNILDIEPFQVAVQCRSGSDKASQLHESCGSLVFDWKKYEQNPTGKLPLKDHLLKETDFTETCDLFKNTYIETVIDQIKNKFPIVRGRFMKMKHKTCLSMHSDKSKRIHIPIYTNENCMMIVDSNIVKLPFGKTYLVDTTYPHTAINASKDSRVHLDFCIS